MSDTYPRIPDSSKKKPLGDKCVELMVRVLVIAAFILWLMPAIANAVGVSPESYEKNEILWTIAAGFFALVVSVPVTRLISRSIRSGG